MSKYTTEVRFICESAVGLDESAGYDNVNDIIKAAAPSIFGTDWPIFDEAYRLTLECKILRHYYTREISEETAGLWKLRLTDRMNMIMPYYNKLYESELLKFNPLYDVDLFRKRQVQTDGTSTSTENGHSNTQTENAQNRTIAGTNTSNVTTNNTSTSNSTTDGTSDTTNQNTSKRDYSDTGSSESSGEQSANSSTDTTNRRLYSDTPQDGVDFTEVTSTQPSSVYLTNLTKDIGHTATESSGTNSGNTSTNQSGNSTVTDNGTSNTTVNNTVNGTVTDEGGSNTTGETNTTDNLTGNGSSNTFTDSTAKGQISNTEDYLEHVYGKQGYGNYSKMLSEYRSTFLNIDKMVVDDLSDLFFGLW